MNGLCRNASISTIRWRRGLTPLRGVPLKEAALPSPKRLRASRSKASPTRPSVSEPFGEECVLSLPDRGGSLKRLHRPNLLGLDHMSFKEHQSFKPFYEYQPCWPLMRAIRRLGRDLPRSRATKTGGGQGIEFPKGFVRIELNENFTGRRRQRHCSVC